jgi:hypothetical protein
VKKQKTMIKSLDADLRLMPYVLKDGDILGFRVDSELTADEIARDDFSTNEDILAADRLRNLKLLQEANKYEGSSKEKQLIIDAGF